MCIGKQPSSGQRLVSNRDLSNPALISSSPSTLSMEFSPGHTSVFDAAWLRAHTYTHKALSVLDSSLDLVSFDYSALVPDSLPLLQAINSNGVVLVKNVEDVLDVARLLNSVPSHAIYGATFDVVTTPNPINVAYSSEALELHMDLAYYESPPGLQLLHCMEFSEDISGGESTFLDAHAVAERFQVDFPEYFKVG